ncbi:PREDICTED: coiled-coil domain-containing protein 179 [Chrysochloris asiatica]|uniref:Coiled-coil domain-containing protein 179 n=1 Tax=Chrysochloris asiatica TaxID=185453 RepID=A0A9B0WWA9_CHRAS|nr:PREDICTED: coiled-coil domain-containing protein 179 [Chrysochloris asiatica]
MNLASISVTCTVGTSTTKRIMDMQDVMKKKRKLSKKFSRSIPDPEPEFLASPGEDMV